MTLLAFGSATFARRVFLKLDDRFRETGIFREAGVHGTGELLVDSLFRID